MTLKTVGASGQISLGKKYAGKHFVVIYRDDGSIQLKSVKVVANVQARSSGAKARYRTARVRKIVKLSRDQMHER